MTRSRSTPAIILKNSRIGEIHKGVTMLTPDDGLIGAIAHGAYSQRGKLRGTTNLFCTGTAYLYTDPVRKSNKITDMEVRHYFSGIREDLTRFYTASLWAETVLKTYATGGESSRLFVLIMEGLEQLESRPPEESEFVSVQFVWRLFELSGLQPDIVHCACCGEFLKENEPAYFSLRRRGFCGPEFATEDMPRWQPGAVAYMRHAGRLSFGDALRVRPPAGSIQAIKRVLYRLLQEHVEAPLNTLRTGSRIL